MSETDADLSNLTEWLENLKKNEAEQSRYASSIIKKHLENAGLPFNKSSETTTWKGVGWDLYLNVDQYLRDEKYHSVLKAMFADLVDFCEISTSESFAYKLKILLEKFIENELQRTEIIPLLPPKAIARFDEIKRMMDDDHERYMEILNQQGY